MISLNSLHWKIICANPLTMVYRPSYPYAISTPYPLYLNRPTHGISTPHPWYFDSLSMVYRPPTDDTCISSPLPMVFSPPAYLLIRNEGGQNTMGFNLPYRGVNIPYDTGPFFIHELSPDL